MNPWDDMALTPHQRAVRKYYYKNRDKILRKQRHNYQQPEYKKKHREQALRWQREHPERVKAIQSRHRNKFRAYYKEQDRKRYQANRGTELARAKVWRERNREAHLARRRQFYSNNRDRIKEASKKWSKANSDWRRVYMKMWRANNADKVQAQKERWNRENHERVLQHKRNLRTCYAAQLNEYLRKWTAASRTSLLERLFSKCLGICYICGNPLDLNNKTLEVDHYIPTCLGGSNDEGNFRLTHRPCNRRKSGKHPEEVLQTIA